ncbi:HEAT repeat domain-containing protein [Synechococcus sp. CBW1107]|uniref:HEAT repeat domain-containing protein n=1 Tax=Synechococcus sp. CBW1107 TaxID=2789857 RepID=UPI0018CE2772|nr:HEAT repeat domain-containing protein [Synechococcus sp. CBW1107]QPN55605.1 HEAT repeat domain-containing protein [Synechococcus sp. CBW1107]
MQQALPAAAALLLVFWLLRRRTSSLSCRDDGRAVAAVSRARLERLGEPAVPALPSTAVAPQAPALSWPAAQESGAPLDPYRRRQLLAELRTAAAGSPGERLAALAACLAWGDRACLPLLRRARFDPDPRVAVLAAEAIAAFRGRPAAAAPQPARLPRNVARTR